MDCFFSENFYPENFILLGVPECQRIVAENIVSEACSRFPEKFGGNSPSVSFELRYCPPFEKGFKELKRLQGMAAQAAGRRDEFRGYVIINLSNYLTHEEEKYFDIALRFLIDMSDCWKYIFLVDNHANGKAVDALVQKTLGILKQDIPCEFKKCAEPVSVKEQLKAIFHEQGVNCAEPVSDFFQELMEREGYDYDMVSALIKDISSRYGQKIDLHMMVDHYERPDLTLRYMLGRKKYERFVEVYKQRKELWYGEKQEI